MDEFNKTPAHEPVANQPEADSSQSKTPANGGPAMPPPAARSITSKRIVIPTEAKRAGKRASPTPSAADKAPDAQAKPEQIVPPPIVVAPTTPEIVQPSSEVIHPSAPPTETTASSLAEKPTPVAPEAKPPQTPSAVSVTPDTAVSSPRGPMTQSELKPDLLGAQPKAPVEPTRGLSTSTMPYRPTDVAAQPVIQESKRGRRGLEIALWGIALLLLAVAAFLVIPQLFPNLFSNNSGAVVQPTATALVAIAPSQQPSPTVTQLPTEAPTQPVAAFPTTAPLVIPTPPTDGEQLSVLADPELSGWVSSDDDRVHYGDANLNAGTLQGKSYASILQFNLRNLPTDTKVLFAALELTGREATNLGGSGEWQVELVENSLKTDWVNATPEQIAQAKSLGSVGTFNAADLGNGRLNRLILGQDALQILAQQFKNGNAVLRLRGPEGAGDNLFAWESGSGSAAVNAPTLHLVVVPGKYVVVTNTPQPRNVLTAAAHVVRGTDAAKRNGTPTPFPPGVATATPGGEQVDIPFETAVARNDATAIARAQLATAIARTTGTYTPTPKSVVIIYPTFTPVVISPNELETATPIPEDVNLIDIPIEYDKCNCQGRILLYSNRYGGERPYPIMIEPDGTELGKLSGDLYYRLAAAREPYSPDRQRLIVYPNDSKGVQQIGILDLDTQEVTFLTHFPKGIAYDGAWAPDGSAIVFVGTELDNADQIYLYDFGTEQVTTLVKTPGGQPWFKHPSWSPDSKQIVYWSSVSGIKQIWIMNRDGSNQRNISTNDFNEFDPVWVK